MTDPGVSQNGKWRPDAASFWADKISLSKSNLNLKRLRDKTRFCVSTLHFRKFQIFCWKNLTSFKIKVTNTTEAAWRKIGAATDLQQPTFRSFGEFYYCFITASIEIIAKFGSSKNEFWIWILVGLLRNSSTPQTRCRPEFEGGRTLFQYRVGKRFRSDGQVKEKKLRPVSRSSRRKEYLKLKNTSIPVSWGLRQKYETNFPRVTCFCTWSTTYHLGRSV